MVESRRWCWLCVVTGGRSCQVVVSVVQVVRQLLDARIRALDAQSVVGSGGGQLYLHQRGCSVGLRRCQLWRGQSCSGQWWVDCTACHRVGVGVPACSQVGCSANWFRQWRIGQSCSRPSHWGPWGWVCPSTLAWILVPGSIECDRSCRWCALAYAHSSWIGAHGRRQNGRSCQLRGTGSGWVVCLVGGCVAGRTWMLCVLTPWSLRLRLEWHSSHLLGSCCCRLVSCLVPCGRHVSLSWSSWQVSCCCCPRVVCVSVDSLLHSGLVVSSADKWRLHWLLLCP